MIGQEISALHFGEIVGSFCSSPFGEAPNTDTVIAEFLFFVINMMTKVQTCLAANIFWVEGNTVGSFFVIMSTKYKIPLSVFGASPKGEEQKLLTLSPKCKALISCPPVVSPTMDMTNLKFRK